MISSLVTPAPAAEVLLAHHAILPAVPFLAPALVMTLTVLAMIIQDRRRPPDPPPDHPDMERYPS